jgi:hypothetical protein
LASVLLLECVKEALPCLPCCKALSSSLALASLLSLLALPCKCICGKGPQVGWTLFHRKGMPFMPCGSLFLVLLLSQTLLMSSRNTMPPATVFATQGSLHNCHRNTPPICRPVVVRVLASHKKGASSFLLSTGLNLFLGLVSRNQAGIHAP